MNHEMVLFTMIACVGVLIVSFSGFGFALGNKLADAFFIPWTSEASDRLRKSWDKSAEKRRRRLLDEIDPAPKKKASKRSRPKSAG